MIKETELTIYPNKLNDKSLYKNLAAKKLGVNEKEIKAVRVLRRSVDARSKRAVYKVKVSVYINEEPQEAHDKIKFQHVRPDQKIIIVGSGPAGLFAAFRLLELGIKPVILERGKDVHERRKDLKQKKQD